MVSSSNTELLVWSKSMALVRYHRCIGTHPLGKAFCVAYRSLASAGADNAGNQFFDRPRLTG